MLFGRCHAVNRSRCLRSDEKWDVEQTALTLGMEPTDWAKGNKHPAKRRRNLQAIQEQRKLEFSSHPLCMRWLWWAWLLLRMHSFGWFCKENLKALWSSEPAGQHVVCVGIWIDYGESFMLNIIIFKYMLCKNTRIIGYYFAFVSSRSLVDAPVILVVQGAPNGTWIISFIIPLLPLAVSSIVNSHSRPIIAPSARWFRLSQHATVTDFTAVLTRDGALKHPDRSRRPLPPVSSAPFACRICLSAGCVCRMCTAVTEVKHAGYRLTNQCSPRLPPNPFLIRLESLSNSSKFFVLEA